MRCVWIDNSLGLALTASVSRRHLRNGSLESVEFKSEINDVTLFSLQNSPPSGSSFGDDQKDELLNIMR